MRIFAVHVRFGGEVYILYQSALKDLLLGIQSKMMVCWMMEIKDGDPAKVPLCIIRIYKHVHILHICIYTIYCSCLQQNGWQRGIEQSMFVTIPKSCKAKRRKGWALDSR